MNLNLNVDIPEFEYKLPQINQKNAVSLTPTGPDSWEKVWLVPEGRAYHTAVRTSLEMVIWGGKALSNYCNDGAFYDYQMGY